VNRRGVAAVTVLLAWAAGVALFARRERAEAPARRLAEAALRVSPGAVYFRVERDGRHVGYASSTIDTAQSGFTVSDYLVADLPVAGRSHRTTARSNVRLSRRFALREFDVAFEADGAPVEVKGAVDGDSLVRVVVTHDGVNPDSQVLRVDGPILLPALLPLAVTLGEPLRPGSSSTIATFDPATMATRQVTVRVEAESLFTLTDSARFDEARGRWQSARMDTVRAWKLAGDGNEGLGGWVDREGRMVEATPSPGVVLRRTAYEIAFENWRTENAARVAARSPSSGILEATAIAAQVPAAPRAPTRLALRLPGVPLAEYDLGTTPRQQVHGDTVVITPEEDAALAATYRLPTDQRTRVRFRRDLMDEPLLQMRAPEIAGLARRIAGDERDPRVVAERLARWVHDSLEKRATVSLPSALQVLRARSGDCNEHTQLYVALARAAGIPARAVSGLAWLNGKFYYHAWPEVLLGRWVAVDPTFGQFPADAAHLRLVEGGLSRQADLIRLMGRLRIEVLDAS
jgi:hypothetical protein